MNPTDCPVITQARLVSDKTTDLTRAIRQLKRQMHLCAGCPRSGDCPVITQFNHDLDAAIEQITIEWHLV
jgi:hypothetical protein